MAAVYFMKDGPGNSGPAYDIDMSVLESELQGKQLEYLGSEPPELNPSSPSNYPSHSVVSIEEGDQMSTLFPEQGFYLIKVIPPKEVSKILFPDGLPDPRL
jgi:hypothetical protein